MHRSFHHAVVLLLAAGVVQAADLAAGEVIPPRFESTGGGGIMIDEYRPVVIGDRCVTRFTATTPQGQVFTNYALFTATPAEGGTRCTEGRFGAVDGSGGGTTPLRFFLKDNVMRQLPPD